MSEEQKEEKIPTEKERRQRLADEKTAHQKKINAMSRTPIAKLWGGIKSEEVAEEKVIVNGKTKIKTYDVLTFGNGAVKRRLKSVKILGKRQAKAS